MKERFHRLRHTNHASTGRKRAIDTRGALRLFHRPQMNLRATTISSRLAHVSVVAVSVVAIVSAVTGAPRGF